MNKREVSLLKRLVDIRIKMKELEEQIDKDIERYWKTQSSKIQLESRFKDFGTDPSNHLEFYDSVLIDISNAKQLRQTTLAEMKKIYDSI